jgi:multicomponent Na+:H+ antiporter subunit G
MNLVTDMAGLLLIAAGLVFFAAGTLGLIRFPDTLTRLHALSKADNLGLGLILAGVALLAADGLIALQLLLTWVAVLAAGAGVAQMVAQVEAGQQLPATQAPRRIDRGDGSRS